VEDSIVVLAQNFGAGWSADLVDEDGTRTPAEGIVVDGWQQGFVVPAGAAGTLEARFYPDGPYRLVLLLRFVAVLALLAGRALWRPGRPVTHQPAVAPVLSERFALVGLWAVLFAGLWGLALGVLAAVVVLLLGRRTTAVITAAVGLAGTALLAWFGPRPLGDSVTAVLPQLVILLAILLALAGAAVADRARSTPRRRP